jgi:cell division septal protein FtsQ
MKKRTRKARKRLHPDTIQLIRRIVAGVGVFSTVALILTAIWYGTRVSALTITEVTVSGGETISHDVLRERVEQQLTGTYLRLVPRTFAYTYPRQDIMASLADIPRIKEITLTRTSGTAIHITFTEFISDALWCEVRDCYFIDDTGYAFATAPSLQGGAFVRFSNERTPAVGESVMTENDYVTIKQFISLLRTIQYDVSAVTTDAAKDAFLMLTKGGEIRITLLESPAQLFDNLETILQSDAFSEVAPGNFKYIDLRFGNKVFVNRTEESEEVATSTDSGLVEFTIEPDSAEEILDEPESSEDSLGDVEAEVSEEPATTSESEIEEENTDEATTTTTAA